MVDAGSLPLTVGAVQAIVTIMGGAFIEMDAVVLQGLDEYLHSAGDFPLGIGIFHPQEQHTAALVGHALGDGSLDQIT